MTAHRVTDGEIIAEFAKRETAAGGPREAHQGVILRETALALGVAYERARAAVLDSWDMGGAG